MKLDRWADPRLWIKRVIAPLFIGLSAGCSPFGLDEGGCQPPPPASDAGSPTASLECRPVPCGAGTEAVRGSHPHLVVGFDCPGTSKTFLAAVKMDGQLSSVHNVQCAEYGSQVTFDAGPWEPPDTVWHTVEVILDPLNLFKETSESNNRGSVRLRIVEPRGLTSASPWARPGSSPRQAAFAAGVDWLSARSTPAVA
jgi:hypothetical protein